MKNTHSIHAENTSNVIVGIDNGISGALVAISQFSEIISYHTMPISRSRKGNEIDPVEVWKWLTSLGDRGRISIIIEEPGGSKSAAAAVSMAGSFHTLRTICSLKGLRWQRITPRNWQRVMLPGCKKGDTKPRALAAARQLWPNETWLPTPRCSKPDEGLIDAALIAEFGRRARL